MDSLGIFMNAFIIITISIIIIIFVIIIVIIIQYNQEKDLVAYETEQH